MKSKRKLLKKSRLYLILDKRTCGNKPLNSIAGCIKDSEVDIIQLRDKTSSKDCILREAIKLNTIFRTSNKLFIINDYPEIAKIVDCDGVHLGQGDLEVKKARKLLGRSKLIGVSCHNLKQAKKAQSEGADYIGIGPVFATKTKPDYLPIGLGGINSLKGVIRIPYFAIGDIKESNVNSIVGQGAKRVAVCRAVLEASDYKKTAKEIKRVLK